MKHYNYFNFSLTSRGKLGGELKQSEVYWDKRWSSLCFVGYTLVGVPRQHSLGFKVSQNLMEQLHHILLQSPLCKIHTHTQTPALGRALALHLALGGPVKEYPHPAFGKPVKWPWKLLVVGGPLCLYQVSSLCDIRSGMPEKQRYVEDSLYGNTNLSRECRESSST